MASQKVHGITIDLDVNASPVKEAFKDINKSINSTQSELKAVDKLLKLDPTNTTLLAQKQSLLSDAIEKTKDKMIQLAKAKLEAEKDGNIDKNSKQYRELERDIVKTKNSLDQLNREAEENANILNSASNSASVFGDVLKANVISDFVIGGVKQLGNAVSSLVKDLNDWAKETRELQVYEVQFENNIKNTTNATDKEIKKLKQLASQKEKQGVISKKSITSAYQELATYVESTKAIEGLTDALLDMSAQQYGIDATEESVRNIATTLGKALANGDYSGLTRLGYGFDEAQQYIMQYGTELEKVGVISDVISASIGGMNEALAQTDAGALFQASSQLDDIKDNIGEAVSQLENEYVQAFLNWFNEDSTKETFEYIGGLGQDILDIASNLTDELQPVLDFILNELIVPLVEDIDSIFQKLTLISSWFDEGTLAKITGFIEEVRRVATLLDAVVWSIANGIKYILNKKDQLKDIKIVGSSSSVGSGGYGSLGFGALNSGGYASGGITLNASFNMRGNTNLDEATAMRFADMLTDKINENLGGLV